MTQYGSVTKQFIFMCTTLYNAGHSDEVASWQYKQWATLGFVRGITTPTQAGQAFCSTQWMSLLFNIIESSLPTPGQLKLLDSSTLLQQVCKKPLTITCTCCLCIDPSSATSESHFTVMAKQSQHRISGGANPTLV